VPSDSVGSPRHAGKWLDDPPIRTPERGLIACVTQKEYGIYGRFRLIPGTDAVVLAGRGLTDVLLGQLSAAGTAAHGVMGATTR
jgi:hypothetical protein